MITNPNVQDWSSVSIEQDTIVTLGNFDGIHLGHLKILDKLKEKSEAFGLKPVVVTFDPHPRQFFSKQKIDLLTSAEEKHDKIKSLGFSDVYFIRFNKSFSEFSPDEFFHKILLERLKARAFVLGENHRFGKNAQGDAIFLKSKLAEDPDKLTIVSPLEMAGEVVCSTLIKKELKQGNITGANKFLGYPYTFTGTVGEGEKRGEGLGFPTANLSLLDPYKLIVAYGVYGGFVWVEGQKYAGIINIGKKPTFPSQKTQIEVHIFQFSRNIYGKKIHLELHFFLRKEKLFKSGEELSGQIHKDITEYKQILEKEKNNRF